MGVGENPPKSHDSAEILHYLPQLKQTIVGSLRCMLGVGFVLLWDPKAAAGGYFTALRQKATIDYIQLAVRTRSP